MRNKVKVAESSVPAVRTVLLWGTFDLGKPRMRMILRALESAEVNVHVIHEPVWDGIEDKSQVKGIFRWMMLGLRYTGNIISLLWRYRNAPPHDAVIIGYPGQFDVIAFRLWRRIRRVPVIWDMFISLYDTVVLDRAKVAEGSLTAKSLLMAERLAARSADLVVLDTEAHAGRISDLLDIPADRMVFVPVGAEANAFPALPGKRAEGSLNILFYGQFIPLHGIGTIIDAARSSANRDWSWTLIGDGQEAAKIAAMLDHEPVQRLEWTRWVNYEQLREEIERADICLGIFGESAKAASVVPNKAYQVLASGRPLVTRDGPAMQELAPDGAPGLKLIPPGDAEALVSAISELEQPLRDGTLEPDYAALRNRFDHETLVGKWRDIIKDVVQRR